MKNFYFKDYYEKTHSEYINWKTDDIGFVINDPFMHKLVISYLKDNMTIADLGAGRGALLYNINKFTKSKLIAVELSEIATIKIKEILPEAIILKENALKTSIEDSSVDFCLCTMLIEHVDDRELLKEVTRILKPNGLFFLSSVIKGKFAWALHINEKGERVLDCTHLHEYKNSDELLNILGSFNFKILKYKVLSIKHPLIDTFFKFFKPKKKMSYKKLKIIEKMRRLIRLPLPGYYSIEILAKI